MSDTPKWPGDHSEKHSAAAHLGWLRRWGKAPPKEPRARHFSLRKKPRQAAEPAKPAAPSIEELRERKHVEDRKRQIAKELKAGREDQKRMRAKATRAAAPPAPPPPPAPPAPADSFKYVATQKSNGKWIVSKVYKSGKVVNGVKEYDKNPVPGPPQKKAPAAPPPGQGSMFGGSYHKSIFD